MGKHDRVKENLRLRAEWLGRFTSVAAAVVAIIALAGTGCAIEGGGAAPQPTTIEELKAALAEVLKRRQTPGVGFAIVTADEVEFAGGVGKADLATGRDIDGATALRRSSRSSALDWRSGRFGGR
jgi:hypothetical protein